MLKPNRWKCAECGAAMHREVASAAEATQKAMFGGSHGNRKTVHVCGTCRTFHLQDGDVLRRVTTGEMFKIMMAAPNAAEFALTAPVDPSSIMAGTLVIEVS